MQGREMAQTRDCTRKCKEVGEITAMKTRAGMEVTSSTGSFKRRKLASDVRDQLVIHRNGLYSPENHSVSPGISENLDLAQVSHCSSNDASTEFVMKRQLRSVDLKVTKIPTRMRAVESQDGGYETDISEHIKCRFSRETTPSSDIFADTDELESSTSTKPSVESLRRKLSETKMPPAEEIEEFFAAAEKQEQKRFADKYNYDVLKDVPLEGRYQWVRLKP